jgi:hypothetical protein
VVLRCLRAALERTDAAWVVLISGQDYPIRPVAEIERSLAGAELDAFVEAWPVARPPLRRGAPEEEFGPRYHCLWRRVPPATAGPLRSAAALARPLLRVRSLPSGTWAGVPAARDPFGPGLVCHRGADWFSLSRRAVETVDRFAGARPDVLRHYRRTLLPTESFVQTVLANEPGLRLSGDHRRFSVWDPPPATSPRVLRGRDLDGIIASGADFARKFDETVDRDVLDAIDRRVHHRFPPGTS